MKKFLTVSMMTLLCMVITRPVAAKIEIGGTITMETFYYKANDARTRSLARFRGAGLPSFPVPAANPDSAFTALDFRFPAALNRITLNYANDDNTIRARFELRGGSQLGRDVLDTFSPNDTVYWNYANFEWHLSPKTYLLIGRQTQNFAIRYPRQWIGQSRGHIVGAGFGNVHGGSSRDGVRCYHSFNDTVSLRVGLYDPDTDGREAIAGFSPEVINGATATILEENVIPRIDVTVPLNFGNIRLWPSATYLRQKYDQVGPGREDHIDIWGFAVGGLFKAGPLSLNAEVTYGQNLGAGNYVGAFFTIPAGWNSNPAIPGNDSINDAKIIAGWLQLDWDVGPLKIRGIFGASNEKREDDPNIGATGTNLDLTRFMYGINVPIFVNNQPKLVIIPEIMAYDLGTDATVGNTLKFDHGKEYIMGIQFMFFF